MRVFSADGGGYLGLATAAFIDGIEKSFGKQFSECFDLFCGTSTGAIIALALASGKSGSEIVQLYQTLGNTVFRHRFPWTRIRKKATSLAIPMYARAPLDEALKNTFGTTTLGDLHAAGKLVIITAFSVTNGRPRIFKTDHGKGLDRDNKRLVWEVAAASASAPVYFAPIRITDPITNEFELFCDGGLFANHPALLGLSESLSHLETPFEEISILSVSTPRGELGRAHTAEPSWKQHLHQHGAFFWGLDIFSMMMDGTSSISDETLRRLIDWKSADGRYQRIGFVKPNGCEMDIATESTTTKLKQCGYNKAADGATRDRVAQFFE